MGKRILPLLFLILSASDAGAHQPRIVKSNFVEVSKPEVSQAFYAELKGEPTEYQIRSEIPFRLYVGLLVPDLPRVRKDISADIFRIINGKPERLAFLEGANFEWTPFFEEFAGDNYFWGPEFSASNSKKGEILIGKEVPAGTYRIRVFNLENRGKYTLVVGDLEQFPIQEILKAIVAIPRLKKGFFEKSYGSAIFNRFNLAFAVAFLVLLVFTAILARWILRLFLKHRIS